MASLLVVLSLCGCMGARKATYCSRCPISFAKDSAEGAALWTAIQDTLRDNRLRLDRVDRRDGVITTYPEVSQHFFEFWRHDVDTSEDLWESTINPIRRRVEARLETDKRKPAMELSITVTKERYSSPDRQFNHSGAAFEFFGDALPTTTGDIRVDPEADQWITMGRDPAMEEYYLRHILARVAIAFPASYD